MADIEKLVDRVRGQTQMRPVLPVGQPMSIGDVGYIDNGGFRYLGTAKSFLQINRGAVRPDTGLETVRVASGSDVTIHAGGSARTAAPVAAAVGPSAITLEVTFMSENSFLFVADHISVKVLAEPIRLVDAMLTAYQAGRHWKAHYCFVYQTGTARSSTIFLSEQGKSSAILRAKAAVQPGMVEVADVDADLGYASSHGAMTQVTGRRNTVVLFNAYKIKKSLLGRKRSNIEVANIAGMTIREAADSLGDDWPFEEV